jgi:hypothetical protein
MNSFAQVLPVFFSLTQLSLRRVSLRRRRRLQFQLTISSLSFLVCQIMRVKNTVSLVERVPRVERARRETKSRETASLFLTTSSTSHFSRLLNLSTLRTT